MDLTDVQRDALSVIASLPRIWPLEAQVEQRLIPRPPGIIDELVALGLVTRWRRPDGHAITLTGRAASLLGLVTEERWQYRSQTRKPKAEPGKLAREVRVRIAVGIPRWVRGEPDAEGDLAQPRRLVRMEAGLVLRERPVMPLIYAEEAPPGFLFFTPPPKKGTTEYIDEDGETTTDPAKAKKVMGVPLVVDGRKQRQRPVEAARRALAGSGARKRA